jgi:hypothetical protein
VTTRNDEEPRLPLLSRGLRRRDVLAMSAVAVATPLLSRAVRAQELLAAPTVANAPISFGYVDESIQYQNLRRTTARLRAALRGDGEGGVARESASAVTVVPADSLASGDPSLSNTPVRLRINGLFPNLPKSQWPSRIDLDVFVKSPDVPQGATFFAWSWRARPENLSAPLAFNVSPDFQSEVTFVLRTQGRKDATPTVQRATFTLGDDPGKPRLQRGAYLLAVNGRPWDREVTFAPDLAKPAVLSLLLTAEPTAPAP